MIIASSVALLGFSRPAIIRLQNIPEVLISELGLILHTGLVSSLFVGNTITAVAVTV
jgi:hypothetical protein